MNHLAHFALAAADDDARAGTLLGDFVRGPVLDAWPPAVQQAIRLHRRVDAFTDTHPLVARARGLWAPPWRRYAGIVLDVVFDHLLMRDWAIWHAEPLDDFLDATHGGLARIAGWLDEPARGVAARMATHGALAACATRAGMERSLARIGARFSRPVALAEALPAALAADTLLRDLFGDFYPQLRAEAAAYRAASSLSSRPSGESVNR